MVCGTAWAQNANTTPWRWVAGDVPPFAWLNDKGPQGYAYELAVALAQRAGRQSDVSFYPWARAMRLITEGQNYGIFPLARTPEREAAFQWLVPLMKVKYSFFFRRGDENYRRRPEQLRGFRIGVMRGSVSGDSLRAQQYSHVIESKDFRDMLRMLNEGMIQAIYAGTPMLNSAMVQYGFNAEDYRMGHSLDEVELFMAVPATAPSAEVERLRSAYRELQQDGTVARLQKKYLSNLDR